MQQKRRGLEEIIRIIRQAEGGRQAVREHEAPDHLRSDNGSEFIEHVVQDWFREHGIKTINIEPGGPWQNGWIGSFHACLRDECLNRELLLNLRIPPLYPKRFANNPEGIAMTK